MLLSKSSEPSREVVLNQVLRPKAQRLQHSSGVAVLRSLGIHGAVSPLSLACSIVVDDISQVSQTESIGASYLAAKRPAMPSSGPICFAEFQGGAVPFLRC